MSTTIGIIGAGKMGEALAAGLVASKYSTAQNILFSDSNKKRLEELHVDLEYSIARDNVKAACSSDIVILAVKPDAIPSVLEEIGPHIGSEAGSECSIVISVAAGVTLAFLEAHCPPTIPVFRCIPNLACRHCEGVSAIASGRKANEFDIAKVKAFFGALGSAVFIEERLMNAATGLSGAGPAYAFLVIEALTDAGIRVGLGSHAALTMSAQTLLGAARMVLESGIDPAALRHQVSTPGGATVEGLYELEAGGIRSAFIRAVSKSTQRTSELFKEP